MAISADRAAEFNRLLIEQGHTTQSMKYGWKPTDEEQSKINDRGARLVELAELLGSHKNRPGLENTTPGAYVNDRIATWMRANPVALTNDRLAEVAEASKHCGNPDTGVTKSVIVQIGETGKGYGYALRADDLRDERYTIVLTVPESVAEQFRQQGRRNLQRELSHLMGYDTPF